MPVTVVAVAGVKVCSAFNVVTQKHLTCLSNPIDTVNCMLHVHATCLSVRSRISTSTFLSTRSGAPLRTTGSPLGAHARLDSSSSSRGGGCGRAGSWLPGLPGTTATGPDGVDDGAVDGVEKPTAARATGGFWIWRVCAALISSNNKF